MERSAPCHAIPVPAPTLSSSCDEATWCIRVAAALLSAQPEVDDFDGLFAVIVGRERERVFPLAPHEQVGTFSGNITFPFSSSLVLLLPSSLHVSQDFSFI